MKVNLKVWEHVLSEQGVRVTIMTLRASWNQEIVLAHTCNGLVDDRQPACTRFEHKTNRAVVVHTACSGLCQAYMTALVAKDALPDDAHDSECDSFHLQGHLLPIYMARSE